MGVGAGAVEGRGYMGLSAAISSRLLDVQGSAKRGAPGSVNFAPAVAYQVCLACHLPTLGPTFLPSPVHCRTTRKRVKRSISVDTFASVVLLHSIVFISIKQVLCMHEFLVRQVIKILIGAFRNRVARQLYHYRVSLVVSD